MSNYLTHMLKKYYFKKGYKDACKEILLEMNISEEMINAKKELDELKNEYYNINLDA